MEEDRIPAGPINCNDLGRLAVNVDKDPYQIKPASHSPDTPDRMGTPNKLIIGVMGAYSHIQRFLEIVLTCAII